MFKKKFSDDEIRIKAHEIWRSREEKGKTSDDDWNEAIEALKTDHFINLFFEWSGLSLLFKWSGLSLLFKWSGLKCFFEWTGFKEKKGWDFLQLLIVPAVLSGGALYLQDAAKQRDTKAADEKAKQDTLTKYFDQMADLLLKEKLLQNLRNPDSEIFIIGRSKTVTVLQSLDPDKQHLVIQFLKSANLNGAGKNSSISVLKTLYLKAFLKKGLLYQAKMSNTNLSKAKLSEANLSEADLSEANLSEADLFRANFSEADLFRANLSSADLISINLSEANLDSADLRYANLRYANLSSANLPLANLPLANLLLANLRQANLRQANLRQANLNVADLRKADLTSANLSSAILISADLRYADLRYANLTSADLRSADLTSADLRYANLSSADLRNANLSIKQIEKSCNWQYAKFSDDFRKQLDKSISQKVNPNCEGLFGITNNTRK